MSRLGRVTASAGREVIDSEACFLSLLAQAAVWLLELRVFPDISRQFAVHLFRPWTPGSAHGIDGGPRRFTAIVLSEQSLPIAWWSHDGRE